MPFVCTECKTKFENRPQFCDCGNDSFDELKKDVLRNFPILKRILSSTDKFSLTIFLICIFFSILIWVL